MFCVQVVWFLSKCSSVQKKARDAFQKLYGLGKGRRLKEIDKLLRNLLATLSLISLCSSGNLSTSWLIYVFSWKCDSCPFLDPAPFCSCCSSFCLKARVFSNCDLRFISTLVLKSFYPKYSHIVQWSTASYTDNLFRVCDQNVEHSKTESDVWSYWKWSCLREGAWLCQDSPTIIFLLENTFFWQPLYLLTKQKNICTIFVNAEYPELRSEASNIIFWAPLKANEGGRSDVSQKMNFLPHYGS